MNRLNKLRLQVMALLSTSAIAFTSFAVMAEGKEAFPIGTPLYTGENFDAHADDNLLTFSNVPEGTEIYRILQYHEVTYYPAKTNWTDKAISHNDKLITLLDTDLLCNYSFRTFNDFCFLREAGKREVYFERTNDDIYLKLPDNVKLVSPSSSKGTASFDPNQYAAVKYCEFENGSLVQKTAPAGSFNYDLRVDVSRSSDQDIRMEWINTDIKLAQDSFVFTGEQIKPEILGLSEYVEGTDYTVTYDDTFMPGSHKVTVTPLIPGRVTGVAMELTYTITEPSGYCGDPEENISWALDPESRTLTFKGSGEIKDYSYSGRAPWASVSPYVEKVDIGMNITRIGNYAFADCSDIVSVSMPESITDIGEYAFSGCSSLEEITINQQVTSIASTAFTDCTGMNNIYCYAPRYAWKEGAYYSCFKREAETLCHLPRSLYDEYALTPHDYDLNLSYDEDASMQTVRMYGYQMSLRDGLLKVDFYLEDLYKMQTEAWGYIRFTDADGNVTEDDHYHWAGSGDKTVGYFTYSMPAKNINDPVKAQLFSMSGDAISPEYTFSAAEYADYIHSHPSDFDDGKYSGLIEALLSYCACAQNAFGRDAYPMEYSYVNDSFSQDELDQIKSDLANEYSDYDMGDIEDKFYGSSLLLKSGTSLKLYFEKDSVELSGTVPNVRIDNTASSKYTIIYVDNISWHALGRNFSIGLRSGDKDSEISVSPLVYCYKVLDGDYDIKVKNAAASLYKLYQEADRLH